MRQQQLVDEVPKNRGIDVSVTCDKLLEAISHTPQALCSQRYEYSVGVAIAHASHDAIVAALKLCAITLTAMSSDQASRVQPSIVTIASLIQREVNCLLERWGKPDYSSIASSRWDDLSSKDWNSTFLGAGLMIDLKSLDSDDLRLIGLALHASVFGPFFDDVDFYALFGLTREEVKTVTHGWPDNASDSNTELAVNNSLANLRGYPHGHEQELRRILAVDEDRLEDLLRKVRRSSGRLD